MNTTEAIQKLGDAKVEDTERKVWRFKITEVMETTYNPEYKSTLASGTSRPSSTTVTRAVSLMGTGPAIYAWMLLADMSVDKDGDILGWEPNKNQPWGFIENIRKVLFP